MLYSLLAQPTVEVGQVVVKVGLANLCVPSGNVLYKRAEVNTVQPLNWIVKDCIEDVVDANWSWLMVRTRW